MEGARWNLDSGSFDAAKKAWRRLVAEEDDQKNAATAIQAQARGRSTRLLIDERRSAVPQPWKRKERAGYQRVHQLPKPTLSSF